MAEELRLFGWEEVELETALTNLRSVPQCGSVLTYGGGYTLGDLAPLVALGKWVYSGSHPTAAMTMYPYGADIFIPGFSVDIRIWRDEDNGRKLALPRGMGLALRHLAFEPEVGSEEVEALIYHTYHSKWEHQRLMIAPSQVEWTSQQLSLVWHKQPDDNHWTVGYRVLRRDGQPDGRYRPPSQPGAQMVNAR